MNESIEQNKDLVEEIKNRFEQENLSNDLMWVVLFMHILEAGGSDELSKRLPDVEKAFKIFKEEIDKNGKDNI